MEKALTQLFDWQKFAGNAALAEVIDAVHARRNRRQLTMEEAELISAAGSAEYLPPSQKPGKVRRP